MEFRFDRMPRKSAKPFPHLIVDNLLTEAGFKDLIAEYRSTVRERQVAWDKARSTEEDAAPADYLTFGGGRSRDSQEKFEDFFSDVPNWRNFIAILKSEAFCREVWNAIDSVDSLRSRRPRRLREPSYKAGLLSKILFENYYVNFKLSHYPAGSGIALHRDHGAKMVAMLYYLGFSDGVERDTGGTQMYSDEGMGDWSTHQVDHHVANPGNLKLHLDKTARSNSFLAFKRTENSWHGVRPIPDLPRNIFRENLQINFMRVDDSEGLGKAAAAIGRILADIPARLESARESARCLRIFAREMALILAGKLNTYSEIRNPISRRLIHPLKLIKTYAAKNLLIKDAKRKAIRSLVARYCRPPTADTRFVVNYGLDVNKLRPSGERVAFCFGIYNDTAFEKTIAGEFGFRVFAFDPTPVAIEHMKTLDPSLGIEFIPEALWIEDTEKNFYFQTPGTTSQNMSGSLISDFSKTDQAIPVQCRTIKSFMERTGVEHIDLLKMDIEGAAFEVLVNLFESGLEGLPTQIAAEIEIPKENLLGYLARVRDFFDIAEKAYHIYYVPRARRFGSMEVLLVRKVPTARRNPAQAEMMAR